MQNFEREQVASLAQELAGVPVLVEIEKDSLVVYAADIDPVASNRAITALLGFSLGDERQQREWIVQNSRYSPMFRFTLVDGDERRSNGGAIWEV